MLTLEQQKQNRGQQERRFSGDSTPQIMASEQQQQPEKSSRRSVETAGTQPDTSSSLQFSGLTTLEDSVSSLGLHEEEEHSPSTTTQPPDAALSSSTTAQFLEHDAECLYYFGYGPIVNASVRERRGCTLPPPQIQPAILYDHRLKFVEGGTANIVPATGWDVKGILLKFTNPRDFQALQHFDGNSTLQEVTVSLINTATQNYDPQNKNESTAPFALAQQQQQQQQLEGSEHSSLVQSCPRLDFNNIAEEGAVDDDDTEADYSCPFDMPGTEKKQRSQSMLGSFPADDQGTGTDRTTIRAVTLVIPQHSNRFTSGTGGGGGSAGSSGLENMCTGGGIAIRVVDGGHNHSSKRSESIFVGMPQERYLKLMADGLRSLHIDDTYIQDEILSVNYIPNARDHITNAERDYRTFPIMIGMDTLPKLSYDKYDKTVIAANTAAASSASGSSGSVSLPKRHASWGGGSSKHTNNNKGGGDPEPSQNQQQDLYFIVGKKIIKLQQQDGPMKLGVANACTRWIKELCHGKYDITQLVQQTFVDPECELPVLQGDTDSITPEHHAWAEHTVLLYLERGGLTATHVYDLDDTSGPSTTKRRSSFLGASVHGRSMPVLSIHGLVNSVRNAGGGHRSTRSSMDHLHSAGDCIEVVRGGGGEGNTDRLSASTTSSAPLSQRSVKKKFMQGMKNFKRSSAS